MNEKADIEKHEESFSEISSQNDITRPTSKVTSANEKSVGVTRHTALDLNENINAKLANPLAGIPHDELRKDGAAFARRFGLEGFEELFSKAAVVAQDPLGFETMDILSDEEKTALRKEQTHRWDQPLSLYWLVVMCSVAAAVQGVRIFVL